MADERRILAVSVILYLFTVTFDDTKPPPEAVNGHIVLVQIFTRFGALANVT